MVNDALSEAEGRMKGAVRSLEDDLSGHPDRPGFARPGGAAPGGVLRRADTPDAAGDDLAPPNRAC